MIDLHKSGLFSFWRSRLGEITKSTWSKLLKERFFGEESYNLEHDVKNQVEQILGVEYEKLPEPMNDAISRFVDEFCKWLLSKYNEVKTAINFNDILDTPMRVPIAKASSFLGAARSLDEEIWDMRGYLSIITASPFFARIGESKNVEVHGERMSMEIKDFRIREASLYFIFPEMVKDNISFNIISEGWLTLLSKSHKLTEEEYYTRIKELDWYRLYKSYIKGDGQKVRESMNELIRVLCSSPDLRDREKLYTMY